MKYRPYKYSVEGKELALRRYLLSGPDRDLNDLIRWGKEVSPKYVGVKAVKLLKEVLNEDGELVKLFLFELNDGVSYMIDEETLLDILTGAEPYERGKVLDVECGEEVIFTVELDGVRRRLMLTWDGVHDAIK